MQRTLRLTTRLTRGTANFTSTSRTMATQKKMDSSTISSITDSEKEITGQDEPVKGGPTAQAQSHVGEDITADVVSDITKGEKKVTGEDSAVKGGPTAKAQSVLTKERNEQKN